MIRDRPPRLDVIYINQSFYFVTFATRSPVVTGVSPAESDFLQPTRLPLQFRQLAVVARVSRAKI